MVQFSANTCSCIASLWVSLVSFAAMTLCIVSQWVFIVVYFLIDSVRELLDTPSYTWMISFPSLLKGLNRKLKFWYSETEIILVVHIKLPRSWFSELKRRNLSVFYCTLREGKVDGVEWLVRRKMDSLWTWEKLATIVRVSFFVVVYLIWWWRELGGKVLEEGTGFADWIHNATLFLLLLLLLLNSPELLNLSSSK